MTYFVNCSSLPTELPLFERPAAAPAASFPVASFPAASLPAAGFWWPFESPVSTDHEVARFVSAVRVADPGRRAAAVTAADASTAVRAAQTVQEVERCAV